MHTDIKPIVTFSLATHLEVSIFGKPLNWSFRGLSSQEALQDPEVLTHYLQLNQLATCTGINTVFMPRLDECNGALGSLSNFDTEIAQHNKVRLLRSSKSIDAFRLPTSGSATLFRSADCPTIIVWNDQHVTVAHAALKSLFRPGEQGESVIREIMSTFEGSPAHELNVFITCGIAPTNFLHQRSHREQNWNLVTALVEKWGENCIDGSLEDGRIDLVRLIRNQFVNNGVPDVNITQDKLDTFSDERLWSNRAGDKERNGVLIIRR